MTPIMGKLTRLLLVFVLLTAVGGVDAAAAGSVERSPLRILFVGADPRAVTISDAERAAGGERRLALKRARTPDFEKFLGAYFTTVKVVYSTDYRETMSANYDVTIFDALPPPIKEGAGGKPAQYLSQAFSGAALTIAEVSPGIAEALAYKMDWLCQCLNSHAHGMKLDHSIFNTPLKVTPTLQYVPTPPNYREYYTGRNLPDALLMWRVQQEGYSDGKGFPAGMVSSGPGFTDASDGEIISYGESQKGVDSVALGRHGNFFSWGFVAAPHEMTEEGRRVFINAVHYIARFKGQRPYSRRPYQSYAREVGMDDIYMKVRVSYEDWLKVWRHSYGGRKDYLRRLQGTGAKLSADELKELDAAVPEPPDHQHWLQEKVLDREPESVVALFGADLNKYLPYYEANLEYLSPSSKMYTFEVDEDVRSLATSNRDPRLLELCVRMLESGLDTAKANRILVRYTGLDFSSAREWRQWLDVSRSRLYFSDVDGFRFHVAPEGVRPRA